MLLQKTNALGISQTRKGLFLLNSIPKSGTQYFRLLLTNYLKTYFENISKPVSFREMDNIIFPNIREALLPKDCPYRQPEKVIQNTHYPNFEYGHTTTLSGMCQGKIVSLHRNPLDTIVSRFFYTWKYRPGRENLYQSPRNIFDRVLEYIRPYLAIKEISNRNRVC